MEIYKSVQVGLQWRFTISSDNCLDLYFSDHLGQKKVKKRFVALLCNSKRVSPVFKFSSPVLFSEFVSIISGREFLAISYDGAHLMPRS